VLQQAVLALANICCCSRAAIKQRAANTGAVEALVQLMSGGSQDPGVLQQAVLVLWIICIGGSVAI
jgi:hypothetical protein